MKFIMEVEYDDEKFEEVKKVLFEAGECPCKDKIEDITDEEFFDSMLGFQSSLAYCDGFKNKKIRLEK